MSRAMLPRFFSGVFAIWFVALGVTRGSYMACLSSGPVKQMEAAALATALASPLVNAHAGHGVHAARDAGATAAVEDHGHVRSGGGSDAPEHCNCANDCSDRVPAPVLPTISIACAPDARVVPAIPEFAQTSRLSTFVTHLLPFATAPPAAPLIT